MAAATNLVRWGIRLGTWRWQRWRVQGKQRFESVRVFDFYTVWLFLFVDWTQEGSFIVVYCRSFSTASANIHQKKNLPAIRVNEPTRPWIHIQVRPNDRHKYSHSVRIRNRNSTPLYSQFYISPIVWDAIWTYMPICIIYIYIYPICIMLQSNLGSRTPRIMNNSVCEQIFRTQSVSDDILCLELRTRKPSTSWSDKLGVSASAVFVEEWSSGKYSESATPIGESVSCCVAFVHSNSLRLLLNFSVFCVFFINY